MNIKKCDLALSQAVLFHLIEEKTFEDYMKCLFNSSSKYVLIYSSNQDTFQYDREKHRRFTKYVENSTRNWELIEVWKQDTPETSCMEGYLYKKR